MYTRYTELRRLHERDEYNLALKLNERDCWRLMEIIPHHINAQQCSDNGTLNWQQALDKDGRKYCHEHFELMKNAFIASGGTRMISQILLDEWKTSGRKEERPTLGVLLQLLVGAECWMAADFLAAELLHEAKPERPLEGPAARFHFPISEICDDVESYVNNSNNYLDTAALAYSVNGFNNMNNNQDYRTKFMLNKNVDMTMSSDVNINNVSTAEVLNDIANEQETSTTNTQANSSEVSTSKHNIPLISKLMTKESHDTSTTDNHETYTFMSEANIPNLSILSMSTVTDTPSTSYQRKESKISQEILPQLSELYINLDNTVDSSSNSSSNDEQIINVNDVSSQSVPNLSIFEQHSSNNDSSLTSVTGTSGENSFEISSAHEHEQNTDMQMPEEKSDNNIPCLSALRP